MRPIDGCAALAAPHRPGGLLSRPGGLLSTFTEDVNDRPRICGAPLLGDAARSGRIAITASASRGRRGNSQAQWRSRCCVACDVVTSVGNSQSRCPLARSLSPQVNSAGEIWNRRDDEPTRLGLHTNPVDAFRRELRTGDDEAFTHPGPGAVVCMPAGHGRRSSDRSAGF
jgi:hypothetical protein